jgi:hypothetical protein
MSKEMKKYDLTGTEEWREYDFDGRVYRIDNPTELQFYSGSTTHRVTDSNGIVHCVPAPGQQGCVLRWKGPVIF